MQEELGKEAKREGGKEATPNPKLRVIGLGGVELKLRVADFTVPGRVRAVLGINVGALRTRLGLL